MKNTQQLIYCTGLPASGKSTWSKEQVANSNGTIKRVNKDDLRAMLDVSVHSKDREKFVVDIRDEIIRRTLREGKSVISDDTNFGQKHPARFQELADEYTAETGNPCEVIHKSFEDVSVQECIKRDAGRTGVAHVGEKVIMRMYSQFLRGKEKKYVPPVDGLSKCVICDLDGTLALIDHRNPFDASNCDEDEINLPVLEALKGYKALGYTIIFMSGREDKYLNPTLKFLDKCGLRTDSQYNLYMRKSGDMRKDSIVKKELFMEHIHGKFDPLVWIDDRQQVCQMTRHELGVTVFQVADGMF